MAGEAEGSDYGDMGSVMNISFVKWVTVARASELTGYSKSSIEHKIQCGPGSQG